MVECGLVSQGEVEEMAILTEDGAKNGKINIYMASPLRKRLYDYCRRRERAIEERVSMSGVVVKALERYLNEVEKKR